MSESTDLNHVKREAEAIKDQFVKEADELKQGADPQQVEALRLSYLGRKGRLNDLMGALKQVSKEDKPEAGKVINTVRQLINETIEQLQSLAMDWKLEKLLNQKPLDVSLPGVELKQKGSLHPVSLVRTELLSEFRKLGFTVMDGPELETDFYNFAALNFKDDHPARDMQDTFFVSGFEKTVMRTHTSNIQVHAMLANKPPLRIVAPGRVYRCDSDLTHTPMFHQIEGLVVDQNVSMGDMKGVVDKFLKAVFGEDLETRLRPSFFPFVEPGGEVDLQCVACKGKGCRICSDTGWLEIGGLGMIHPNVFEAVDIDSERYTGFAFGFGIDRIAMLKYSLGDLRQLFDGDQPFLSQFPLRG